LAGEVAALTGESKTGPVRWGLGASCTVASCSKPAGTMAQGVAGAVARNRGPRVSWWQSAFRPEAPAARHDRQARRGAGGPLCDLLTGMAWRLATDHGRSGAYVPGEEAAAATWEAA